MKKLLAMLIAVLMVVSMFAACGTNDDKSDAPVNDDANVDANNPDDAANNDGEADTANVVAPAADKEYVYKDSVSTLATNWNPHTYQNTDDSYPADFLRMGFYNFVFNDAISAQYAINDVEGKEDFTGYAIVPEMAASAPVDVTEAVKAEHPEFGIPESADSGYAYTIDLNPDAKWEDGTPITADDYVYSMKKLLDPDLKNYRATDYYSQNFVIAGAEAYANNGKTSYKDSLAAYAVADLVKGADGQYATAEGDKMYIGLDFKLDWTGGNTLKDYVDDEGYGANVFDLTNWEALIAMADENGLIPLTDENLALFTPVTTGNPAWGETDADLPNYFVIAHDYPAAEYDSTVGLYKSGDLQITLVLAKSLKGFNLYYNLASNWLVKEDLYEANLTESNGVWTSTYNTSVATTSSYGPYKMTDYQADKHMRFEKNENWYGWNDGKHIYVDPTDGQTYQMYWTSAIDTQVVEEAATRKLMFLKGQLMGYGLQAEDFETYRSSEFCHATPSETIFFLILNGHKESIANREGAADFDKTKVDLEMMTNLNFRKALAVSYDRDLFAATISPARSGGYGLIGTNYIYDPDTGAKYRDTDAAKRALCTFYSVNVDDYASLDEAAASITGFDPVKAKELFKAAFDEGVTAGFITDADGDGKSDQTVRIEYAISSDSDFMTKTINYLNEKINEVDAGTPFEGKIEFVKSAPYGNDWSNKLREGLTDTVLGGWSGSALNPFSLTDLYVNPSSAYDAGWFNAETVDMTMTIDGEEITTNLKNWSDALNGATVTINGKDYNFGEGNADLETRLEILANFEVAILNTYDYLPMLQDGGMSLLSQQVYYVVEEYNLIMGRGGITYMKYNYDETEWAQLLADNGGELKY